MLLEVHLFAAESAPWNAAPLDSLFLKGVVCELARFRPLVSSRISSEKASESRDAFEGILASRKN